MRDLNTVFCHLHSHSQPRYPYFTLCPYCHADAPYEAIVVEAAVNYFSVKLRDFFIQTELEIQMGADKRRADIVLIDGKQNDAAIVECKRIGVRGDGIDQLKSYLCATATPFDVFANSTESDAWEFFENLGRNQFKGITSDLFWKNIQGTLEKESLQPLVDTETYYKRGLANYDRAQYEDAITNYDTAIQLKPDYAEAYYARGNMKFKALFPTERDPEQYLAVIADFDNVIRLKPNDATAYHVRGNAKVELEQYTAAIIDYDTAIRLKPDYAEAYDDRGHAKMLIGKTFAAIADAYKASRILKRKYGK